MLEKHHCHYILFSVRGQIKKPLLGRWLSVIAGAYRKYIDDFKYRPCVSKVKRKKAPALEECG